jgi:hypothetical protein
MRESRIRSNISAPSGSGSPCVETRQGGSPNQKSQIKILKSHPVLPGVSGAGLRPRSGSESKKLRNRVCTGIHRTHPYHDQASRAADPYGLDSRLPNQNSKMNRIRVHSWSMNRSLRSGLRHLDTPAFLIIQLFEWHAGGYRIEGIWIKKINSEGLIDDLRRSAGRPGPQHVRLRKRHQNLRMLGNTTGLLQAPLIQRMAIASSASAPVSLSWGRVPGRGRAKLCN